MTPLPVVGRLKLGNDQDTYMPVYVKDNDRYLSVLVVGRPGTGKSVSLENWWFMDSFYPCAKIAIDPSGFLAKNLYALSRGHALYCSINHPISLNPLLEPYSPIQIADNLIEVVNQVVTLTTPNDKFTVKMRELLTDTTLWCLKNNRKSIDAIRDVLKAQKGNAETRDGIIARLEMLLQDEQFRRIVCGTTTINWTKFIEKAGTLILDCFGMSRDKMIFTGCIITHAIKSHFRYTEVANPKPLLLYIDEAHNFINHNHLDIFKEGRKHKISAILCTQDFANVDQQLVKTMLSNIGTLVSFTCGSREASLLSREFLNLETRDIQSLEKYHFAYKTPEEEGIAKSMRPLFIKQIPIPIKAYEPRKHFSLAWFPLVSYSPRTPTNETERVFADDHEEGSETSPL